MLQFSVAISVLIQISLSLDPLECNGIVYTSNGQINAQPAGVCQADTFSYVNNGYPDYSFMYYCDASSIYLRQWHTSSTCSGDADYEVKMSDEIQNNPTDYGDYAEECNLSDCEYTRVTSYHPFDTSSDIYSNLDSCEAWTPTASDSGYFEAYHIIGYCFDYLADYNLSSQYACSALNGGVVASFDYYGVPDCSGTGTITFSAYVTGTCFQYQGDSGTYYNRQQFQCDVATPSPTPDWTEPITELPCNAVEFEYDGGTVSYPVDVCIHDQISTQSVWFYCDGTTFSVKMWDNSASCEGTETYNGASFPDYVDQLSALIQSKFGEYTTVCDKSQCEYIIMKDYQYTGDCDAFTPTDSTTYTETYFIRDYCLAIDDSNDTLSTGSLAWGCDLEHGHATWISYTDVTDCSDLSKASLSWVDMDTTQCLETSVSTKYVDVTCFTVPTAEPTNEPTKAPSNADGCKPAEQTVVCVFVFLSFLVFQI